MRQLFWGSPFSAMLLAPGAEKSSGTSNGRIKAPRGLADRQHWFPRFSTLSVINSVKNLSGAAPYPVKLRLKTPVESGCAIHTNRALLSSRAQGLSADFELRWWERFESLRPRAHLKDFFAKHSPRSLWRDLLQSCGPRPGADSNIHEFSSMSDYRPTPLISLTLPRPAAASISAAFCLMPYRHSAKARSPILVAPWTGRRSAPPSRRRPIVTVGLGWFSSARMSFAHQSRLPDGRTHADNETLVHCLVRIPCAARAWFSRSESARTHQSFFRIAAN